MSAAEVVELIGRADRSSRCRCSPRCCPADRRTTPAARRRAGSGWSRIERARGGGGELHHVVRSHRVEVLAADGEHLIAERRQRRKGGDDRPLRGRGHRQLAGAGEAQQREEEAHPLMLLQAGRDRVSRRRRVGRVAQRAADDQQRGAGLHRLARRRRCAAGHARPRPRAGCPERRGAGPGPAPRARRPHPLGHKRFRRRRPPPPASRSRTTSACSAPGAK